MHPVKPPRPTEPKKTFMNLTIVQSSAFILTTEIETEQIHLTKLFVEALFLD